MTIGSPNPPPSRPTSMPSEASMVEDILKIDLRGLGLVSRGKLPVFEYIGNNEYANLTRRGETGGRSQLDSLLAGSSRWDENRLFRYPCSPVNLEGDIPNRYLFWTQDLRLYITKLSGNAGDVHSIWDTRDDSRIQERIRHTTMPDEARTMIQDILERAAEADNEDEFNRQAYRLCGRGQKMYVDIMWTNSLMYSSFDEVICLDQPENGYPVVLLIDYDGWTNGRIVNGEFQTATGMTASSGRDLMSRIRKYEAKIALTRHFRTPYVVLPTHSQQRLLCLTEEPLVARFAVIRGLLQAIEMNLMPDEYLVTSQAARRVRADLVDENMQPIEGHTDIEALQIQRTHRRRRDLLIPYFDRWLITEGMMNPEFGLVTYEIDLSGGGPPTLSDDTPIEIGPETEPGISLNMRVEFRELTTPNGDLPDWTEGFVHLPSTTLNRFVQQVDSRMDLTDWQLQRETGFTRSGWPFLIIGGQFLRRPIHVEFQLDGFDTNFSCDESLMMEPYLGVVGSMIIEAGFLGGITTPSNPPAWKPGRLSLHYDSEEE